MKAPLLIDLRNVYRPDQVRAKGFTYLDVGRGVRAAETGTRGAAA